MIDFKQLATDAKQVADMRDHNGFNIAGKGESVSPYYGKGLKLTGGEVTYQKPIFLEIAQPVPDTEQLTMPVNLINPPGLVGEIVKSIRAYSFRDVPELALSGALAAMAHFSNNTYAVMPWGTSLMVYLMVLANTGTGKERPRTWIRNVASNISMAKSIKEGVASGPALLREMSENPELLLMIDEMGSMLEQRSDSTHIGGLVADITMLYGKGTEGSYMGKAYSDRRNNIEPIDGPALTLMGTTTKGTFMDALSSKDINSGFLNRMILLSTGDQYQAKKIAANEIDQSIIDRLEVISQMRMSVMGGMVQDSSLKTVTLGCKHPFLPITPDDEAMAVLEAFDAKMDKLCHTSESGAMYARAGQQALSVSGLLAIGDCDDLNAPVIKKHHAEYATAFVEWSVNKWLAHIDEDMTGSRFEADTMRVLKVIRDARKYIDFPRADKDLCAKGLMTRTLLTRKTRLPARHLDDIITSLGPNGAGDIGFKKINSGTHKNTIVYYATR